MAFRKLGTTKVSATNPVALFRDLRNRTVQGLLDHQSAILMRYYEEAFKEPNVALELPTGSGKTLVGLLIAEYRRRVNGERVIYLCPTKQLVNQVVEQSQIKYGIKTTAFVGSQANFDPVDKSEYTLARTIAVTTYSSLFNTNSFFQGARGAHVIILDDAHASENYISSFWSLLISRYDFQMLYFSLLEALKDKIPETQYQRLANNDPTPSDFQWVEKVPTPKLYEAIPYITPILDEQTKNNNLKYTWSLLRDNLHACHLYLTWNSIMIRPVIPPSLEHTPFEKATQRVYMSATLGASGDLERITGVPKIHRLPIPEGWDKQGLGRRFFMFPEASIGETEATNLAIEMTKLAKRSLILVPDENSSDEIKEVIKEKTENTVFDAYAMEASKKSFTNTDGAVAVLANRFDGIDLEGDECRLLIVKGLPKATNLQEKFLVTRMAASVLLDDRIRTRIVQAIGRCTRNAVDYAAICILGQELIDSLIPTEKIKFYHPELQAELYFGYEQSIQPENAAEAIQENLNVFFGHKEEWDEADSEILVERDSRNQDELPSAKKLLKSVEHEVNYQYAIWNKDFDRAMSEIGNVISQLSGDDVKGYRGFWYYLSGSAAWMAAKSGISSYYNVAYNNFKNAASCTSSVTWLRELVRLDSSISVEENEDTYLSSLIEGLEEQIERIGISSDRKFEKEVTFILESISSMDGNVFEQGHERLGRLLGYKTGNSSEAAAPDPWWIVGDNLCFSFEDKVHEKEDTPIHVHDIRQVLGHPTWIKDRTKTLSKDARFLRIILTTSNCIDEAALTFTEDIIYWRIEEFKKWATTAIEVVRSLKKRFSSSGDLVWRSEAIKALETASLDPKSFISYLEKNLAKNLPTPQSKKQEKITH